MSTSSALLVVTEEVFNIWLPNILNNNYLRKFCARSAILFWEGRDTALLWPLVFALCGFTVNLCKWKRHCSFWSLLFLKEIVGNEMTSECRIEFLVFCLSALELWRRHGGSIVLQLVKLLVEVVKCLHSSKCHCCYVWIIHMFLPDLWQWL